MAERTMVSREVDQRDVHRFSPKIDVVARPVDTFDPNAGLSNSASKLSDALGLATQGLSAASRVFELQNISAEEEGLRLAEEQAEAPEATDSVFSTANITRNVVHRAQAGRDVVDARVELAKLAQEAPSKKEYQKGVDAIRAKYMGGFVDSPAYLSSFERPFQTLQAQTEIQVDQRFRAEYLQDIQEKHTVRISQRVADLVNPLKDVDGIYDPNEVALNREAQAEDLRAELTQLQSELGQPPFNLTKAEVSEWFLGQIRSHAIAQGAPHLLDFADLKDPDGVSLLPGEGQEVPAGSVADQLQGAVFSAREAARRAQEERDLALVRKRDEAREAQVEDFMDQQMGLLAEWATLVDEGSMDPTNVADVKKRMLGLVNSDLAKEIRGFTTGTRAVDKALANFHKMDAIRNTGTQAMANHVGMMVFNNDLEGLRDVLENDPESVGWDNIKIAAQHLTSEEAKLNGKIRVSLLESYSSKRLEKFRRIFQDTFQINEGKLQNTLRDLGKTSDSTFGARVMDAEAARAERTQMRIQSILGQDLERRMQVAYHNARLAKKREPTPEELDKIFSDLYNQAVSDANDVVAEYQKDFEERSQRLNAADEVQKAIAEQGGVEGYDPGDPETFRIPPPVGLMDLLFGTQGSTEENIERLNRNQAPEGLVPTLRRVFSDNSGGITNPLAQMLSLLEPLPEPGGELREQYEEERKKRLQEFKRAAGAITLDDIDDVINSAIQQRPQEDPGLGTIKE